MKHGFSKIVHFSDLRSRTKRFKFNLNEQQRKNVANYLDLIEIKQLDAFLELNGNEKKRQISLIGHLNVEAYQRCVVSDAPVPITLKIEIYRRFTENPKDAEWITEDDDEAGYINAGTFTDDLPDLVEHDEIDLGFTLVEELSLNLNPFPKAEGSDIVSYSTDKNFNPDAPAKRESPFSVLKNVQIKKNT